MIPELGDSWASYFGIIFLNLSILQFCISLRTFTYHLGPDSLALNGIEKKINLTFWKKATLCESFSKEEKNQNQQLWGLFYKMDVSEAAPFLQYKVL